MELKLNSREAQEKAYLVQIDHLKSEVREQQWSEMNGSKGKDSLKFTKVGNGIHVRVLVLYYKVLVHICSLSFELPA